MGFIYHHLDQPDVRESMVELWQRDWKQITSIGHPRECYGKDLTDLGWAEFETAMPLALAEGTDDSLSADMQAPGYWRAKRPHRRYGETNYNHAQARELLCYGEFNVAYIRGLAHALIARGETECVVYRADSAYQPRGECSKWEGQRFTLQAVIDGHRARYWPPGEGDSVAFSIPTGYNCHHSIRAVEPT